MSEFDVGQSVVVSNSIVYAIEALEGTDEMISRAGKLYNNYLQNNDFGPVLIKIPKLKQNLNMDLPVIGLETVKKCNELGFSSIVLSSKGTLIADINNVKNYLKKNSFAFMQFKFYFENKIMKLKKIIKFLFWQVNLLVII